MAKVINSIKGQNVDDLITELGGVAATARACEIATSSVVAWRKTGVPRARAMFLQVKYPKLKVWKQLNA